MNRSWLRSIDAYGRVTIPAELRKECGLTPGTRLVIWVEKGVIYVMSLKEWKKDRRKRGT